MSFGLYILNEDGEPVGEPDVHKWGEWMQTANRHLADDRYIDTDGSEIRVSTVFLGLDHEYNPDRPPLLYETMVFGGEHNAAMWRAATADEAKANHEAALALLEVKPCPEA